MFKNLLTNPITGKIIKPSSNINLMSIIINDFWPKIDKHKKVIKIPKVNIEDNITDDEYFLQQKPSLYLLTTFPTPLAINPILSNRCAHHCSATP